MCGQSINGIKTSPIHESLAHMPIIALFAIMLLCTWLWSAFCLVFVPLKLFYMKYRSQSVWGFLTRRRLAFSASGYFISAPFLLIFEEILGAAASAGAPTGNGGDGSGSSSFVSVHFAGLSCGVFLAAGVFALALIIFRPKNPALE